MARHSSRMSAQSHNHQSAFDAGRKRAADWFTQHGHSLCVFRDQQRAFYVTSITPPEDGYPTACRAFDDGFAEGVSAFIVGVDHA